MTIFSKEELELIELVAEDISHIETEVHPQCTDHQLRRLSVQLRNLLIEDKLIQCWKLLDLQPKQPRIMAPRLRTSDLNKNALAVAANGVTAGVQVGLLRVRKYGPKEEMPSDAVQRKWYEQGKSDLAYPFQLSEYKDSCAAFIHGTKVKPRHIIAYVANKKGGAHLDLTRKKDEEIYYVLDDILGGVSIGGKYDEISGMTSGARNIVYMELLSIGQHITKSPDIQSMVRHCNA